VPPQIVLLLTFVFISFVFVSERSRDAQVSSALLLPLIWYAITASRPVGVWFMTWGIPLPGSLDYTEGTTFDGWVYGILLIMGIYVLARRGCDWGSILSENIWFVILFLFMLMSILWSDYPNVSVKRVIKSFGAAIMALIVLTEQKPLQAMITLLRRSAYFLIPLSIVTIKYYRNIGISWDWSGSAVSWQGVTMSKNILGQVAMTSAFCFLQERMYMRKGKSGRLIDYLYLLMSIYLLKGSDDAVSMTSLSVFVLGLFFFWRLHKMKMHQGRIKFFVMTMCLVIFSLLFTVIWHTLSPFSEKSLMGMVILAMGRDLTLTGRTEIWADVFEIASRSPVMGVGYGAFWIDRLVNIPWTENLTWTLGQAHNGYIDTFLQLGWVGTFLLIIASISAMLKITGTSQFNFEYTCFRLTFILVILYVNITESTFLRGDHNMWFLFLLATLFIPYLSKQDVVSQEQKRC